MDITYYEGFLWVLGITSSSCIVYKVDLQLYQVTGTFTVPIANIHNNNFVSAAAVDDACFHDGAVYCFVYDYTWIASNKELPDASTLIGALSKNTLTLQAVITESITDVYVHYTSDFGIRHFETGPHTKLKSVSGKLLLGTPGRVSVQDGSSSSRYDCHTSNVHIVPDVLPQSINVDSHLQYANALTHRWESNKYVGVWLNRGFIACVHGKWIATNGEYIVSNEYTSYTDTRFSGSNDRSKYIYFVVNVMDGNPLKVVKSVPFLNLFDTLSNYFRVY